MFRWTVAAVTAAAAGVAIGSAAAQEPKPCDRFAESARGAAAAGWRFCPFCGTRLPAPAKPPRRPEPADIPGDWAVKGRTIINKAHGFSITAPAGWTLVGDPAQAGKIKAGAVAALSRDKGGLMALVFAESKPGFALDGYALEVRPNIVNGLEIPAERAADPVDGRPALRREYTGKLGGLVSRHYQMITARDAMKYQVTVSGPAETFTPEVKKEVAALQDGFRFLARPAAPGGDDGDDFAGPFAVRGDVFRHREGGFRLARPGAEWTILAKPEQLKDFPAETAVALTGPDELFAAVMVVKSGEELEDYARKTSPGLDGRRSTMPASLEIDGRRALRIEHRGRYGEAPYTFRQTLAAGEGVRLQLVIWGPAEAVEKHRKAVAAIEERFGFLAEGSGMR